MKRNIGKSCDQIFVLRILETIEFYKMQSNLFYVPDRAKLSWFEMHHTTFECKAEECTLDVDGLWKKNTGQKFWWRIEPNYCTQGRPIYGGDEIERVWKNSETKKVILNLLKTQVCLELNPFLPPTDTCWGLRYNGYRITIYEKNKLIYEGLPIQDKKYKKHLEEFITTYYKYEKDYEHEIGTGVYNKNR